jgi:signal transduction histidine kinase
MTMADPGTVEASAIQPNTDGPDEARSAHLNGPQARLTVLMTLAAAIGLLFAGLALATYIDRTTESRRIDQLSAQARVLAATATAAMDFGDRQAAQEYIDAVGANPEIVAGAMFDAAGNLFVAYPHSPQSATVPKSIPEAASGTLAPWRTGSLLNVTAPIRIDKRDVGLVLLQTPTASLLVRLQRYGPIALLMAMGGLLVGAMGVTQAALRGANAELAERAHQLAESNRGLEEQIVQREKAEAALRQAQKMEAIGQLTGGVAHDFNNLLQIVLGSLERLRLRAGRDGKPLPPELDRMIEAAMQGGRRAATLTQRLLAFSRRQPLAPKPIDLNKLVAGMSDLLGRTLGETIRIETVLGAGLWRTLADENQLENALLNLAVNARDAMAGGGKLTIETANAHLDEAYVRAEDDVKSGQYVLLAVTDTGSGMPADVLGKAFEPFFTTKGVGHGTGLGLSQVYGFIKQSGGHVKIYSEPNEGTTVKIYLPRQAVVEEDRPETGSDRSVPRGRTAECILVVEDEDSVRALSAEIIADLGYAVLEAADGPSALALLDATPGIRLIFTDVGLPGGMNGRQLADAAVLRKPGLKVLFTTGYARNAIVHQGRLDPGVELISKPFSSVDLAHRLRALLDKPTG